MSELAEKAFSTHNYHLAAEIYNQIIKEKGPKCTLYLGLADSYAKGGRIKEALDFYTLAFRLGKVESDQLGHLVDSLVEMMVSNEEIRELIKPKKQDLFICGICKGLWREPLTIHCGHTFCRKCAERQRLSPCKLCGLSSKFSSGISWKNNVLLQNIVNKWFAQELQSLELKDKGNLLFNECNYSDAVKAYSEAFQLAPSDHILTSNRAHALASLGQHQEALTDAEHTVKLRPDWPKGHYRKGMALSALNCYEDAVVSFLTCLALDPSVSPARSALAKSLHRVLSPLEPEQVKLGKRENLSSLLSHLVSEEEPSNLDPSKESAHGDERLSAEVLSELKRMLTEQLGSASELSKTSCASSEKSSTSVHQPSTSAGTSENLQSFSSNQATPESSGGELTNNLQSQPSISADACAQDVTSRPAVTGIKSEEKHLTVPVELLDPLDFECTLCYRLLYEPATTPCGHSFCRQCLDRCLDYNPICPLCKYSLVEYLAERNHPTTEALEQILCQYFPNACAERKDQYDVEIAQLARMGDDQQPEIPVFVCTLAYPTVPCPLHIFEPRYRLMMRQCMQAGTRQFGMVICLENNEEHFANFGTMLEIRDIQYMPDGRSVVDTIGGRRFKVRSRGKKDGYNTAKVEFIIDLPIPEEEEQAVQALHDAVHQESLEWFGGLPPVPRQRILQHFGACPAVEPRAISLPNGPAWLWWMLAVLPLDPRAQLTVLAMKHLKDRLSAIRRVVVFARGKQRH